MNDDFRCMKFIYLHRGEEMILRDPRSQEEVSGPIINYSFQ